MKSRVKEFIRNLKSKISSENGEIGETFTIMIVILAGVTIMYIFPAMTMADRTDDMAQQVIQSALENMVDVACTTNEITPEARAEAERAIASTGIIGDLEITIQITDENPEKKGVQVTREKVDGKWYYTIYTPQLDAYMYDEETGTAKPFKLEPGYRLKASFKNTSTSFGQQYQGPASVLGKNVYVITAEASGMSR